MKIEITKLVKTYGGDKGVRALNDIDLLIEQGMFGLLGPNGAGKTTLMQILATLQPHTSGEIKIGQYTLGRDDQLIRRMLGYLPQEFGVYKKLSGEEYLDYVALMKGMKNSRERKKAVAQMLEQVNLTDKRKKRIGTYSGGMKQRIGIAQALLGNPQVIIVDEPTAGLDPEERIRFRNLLGELSINRIVLLSTHIVADIESSCNNMAIMRKGSLLFHGTQEQLLQKVERRIWTGMIADSALLSLKERCKIISSRKLQHEHEVRVLSDESPFAGATPSRPGLEDGYIAVMEEAVYV